MKLILKNPLSFFGYRLSGACKRTHQRKLKNHIKRYFNIVFADSFSDPIDILLTVPLKDRSTYNELTIPKVFISPQIKHSELKQIYLKISELNELRKQEYKS